MLTASGATHYSQSDLRDEARRAINRHIAQRNRTGKQHGLDSFDIKICQNGLTVLVAHYHDATGIYHTSVVL